MTDRSGLDGLKINTKHNEGAMIMRTVCYESGEQYEGHYVGKWYEGQSKPQDIYFTLTRDGNMDIDYNPEIGNAVSGDVWHNRTLRIELPSNIYKLDEVNEMLDILKPLADKLMETYEEKYNGNNWVGIWKEVLVEELEIALKDFESSISWGNVDPDI